MNFLYWMFFIFFLIPNILILKSDIQEKKIPNKYLIWILLLFPFFFLIDFFYFHSFTTLFFFHIFISLILSFILYYFWVWSAWDAKYLLVLSLFLPENWIIPFIVNIALITLIYLFFYFIYFYTKVIINRNYRKSLWENILKEQKDKIIIFLKHPISWKIEKVSSIIKILKNILYFLIFFISLRLFRMDIMNGLEKMNFIKENLGSMKSSFIAFLWIGGFFIYYIYRFIFRKIRSIIGIFLKKKLQMRIAEEKLKIINISIAVFLLIFIIIFDYIKNGNEVFHKLELILTFYLWLSLLMKILFYSYKITFQIGEQTFIPIKDLKEWEIIDKTYLISIFWTQACLWYKQEKWILSPDPWIKIQEIETPINEENLKLIRKIYSLTNNYHKKNKTPNFSQINNIKILKTFAFWPYIFTWFLITFIFGDVFWKIIWTFWNIFMHFIKH